MDNRDDPQADPFRPPPVPVQVHCLHCNQEYESYLIHWVEEEREGSKKKGFWCCPTPGCGGMGFCFDIFPTDPDYRDEHGNLIWHMDDESHDEGIEDDDSAAGLN